MTSKQMEMYMNGTTDKMIADLREFEKEQWLKATYKGTDAGWRTYRRNVTRKVNEVNKITGFGLEIERIMNPELW